jgi:cyclophilin family peptidyl-prolyl cis-trans isomerase
MFNPFRRKLSISDNAKCGKHRLCIEALEPRQMMAVVAVGDEVLVNNFLVREQTSAASAAAVALSNTSQVVVFTGKGSLDDVGVYAKVYNSAGTALGPAFQVNNTRRGEQHSAAVAIDNGGNFVVVWAGRGAGDKNGIFFRRYSANGTALGNEVLVNTTTGGDQITPTIAMASDGSFAIAWSGVGTGDASGVFMRRFNAAGVAGGNELRINTTIANEQAAPDIAFDASGNLVAAWASRNQDGSDWGIYAQRYNASGVAQGSEFVINSTTTGSQTLPDVAIDPTGGFLVAWQSFGQDTSGWGIVGRRFTATGVIDGAEFVMNNITAGHQQNVSAGFATDGKLISTWTTGLTNGSGWEVQARSYTAAEVADGLSFAVNQDTSGINSGSQHASFVAVHNDDAIIVWSGNGVPDHDGVYVQRFDTDVVVPQQAPNMAAIADGQSAVGAQFEITVTATDPNAGDTLTFTLDPDNSPASATITQTNNNTAIVRWTPTAAEQGTTVNIRVVVTDNGVPALADSEDFQLAVSASSLTVDLNGTNGTGNNATATFVIGGGAVGIVENDLSIAVQGSGNLTEARAQLTAAPNGSAESLSVDTLNTSLVATYSVTTRTLTITGSDTAENYARVLRTLRYNNTAASPSGSRSVAVSVLRGAVASNTATTAIEIAESAQLFIAPIANSTLLIGSPLHVPLDGFDPEGGPLTYTVTTNNAGVTAQVLSGNRSARIRVAGFGDMVFELFEDRAARATQRMIELAEDDFYEDIIFHRVVNNFVIQGGDPTGTGTGGSPLPNFDDQFHPDLQHNRTGLLSMAKTDDDTNDSQFFITEGAQRHLDFNHTIFGLLVEGEAVRDAISNVPVTGTRPTTNVVMEGIDIFEDQENAVVMLKAAPGTTGPVTVTVTVTDQENKTFQRIFQVNVAQDNDSPNDTSNSANSPPFLADIALVSTNRNTTAQVQLIATDVEADAVFFTAQKVGSVDYTFSVSATGLLQVTPPQDFVGTIQVRVGVGRAANTPVTSQDSQLISIQFV